MIATLGIFLLLIGGLATFFYLPLFLFQSARRRVGMPGTRRPPIILLIVFTSIFFLGIVAIHLGASQGISFVSIGIFILFAGCGILALGFLYSPFKGFKSVFLGIGLIILGILTMSLSGISIPEISQASHSSPPIYRPSLNLSKILDRQIGPLTFGQFSFIALVIGTIIVLKQRPPFEKVLAGYVSGILMLAAIYTLIPILWH